MKLKFVAAACVAFCGVAAQAAGVTYTNTVCDTTSAAKMVSTCAPAVTFYAGGSTAAAAGVKAAMLAVFDNSKPIATLNLEGNSNVYGYMGTLGNAAGSASVGKIGYVFFNGTNGSIAGVNQVYSALKTGSIENTVDQKEYITMKVLSAADATATKTANGKSLTINVGAPSGAGDVNTIYVTTGDAASTNATITIPAARNTSFATAWGTDKQKVMHLAVSDVRPSEATPGQVAKLDDKTYPPTTLAMQAFGVAVNGNLYADLVARDVAAGRLPSSCGTSVSVAAGALSGVTAVCQPSLNRAEVASIMTGKVTALSQLGLSGTSGSAITYYRRPNSSGTQAAAQLQFLNQGSYALGSKAAPNADFSLGGNIIGQTWAVLTNGVATAGCSTPMVANSVISSSTCTGTSDVITAMKADTGYAIGVVALNKLNSGFGGKGAFVKLDGFSGNFKADGTEDSKARVGMQNGYPFAYEMASIVTPKLASPYSDIATAIVNGIKNSANNVAGLAYIGDTDATKTAPYTRGGTNFKPLALGY